MGAGNAIESAAGHGVVITIQEIEAVMEIFKYHCTNLRWGERLVRAILEYSG